MRGSSPAEQSTDIVAVAADGPEVVTTTRDVGPVGNLVACSLGRARVNNGGELGVHSIEGDLEPAHVVRGEQPHVAVQVDHSAGDTLGTEAGEIANQRGGTVGSDSDERLFEATRD